MKATHPIRGPPAPDLRVTHPVPCAPSSVGPPVRATRSARPQLSAFLFFQERTPNLTVWGKTRIFSGDLGKTEQQEEEEQEDDSQLMQQASKLDRTGQDP